MQAIYRETARFQEGFEEKLASFAETRAFCCEFPRPLAVFLRNSQQIARFWGNFAEIRDFSVVFAEVRAVLEQKSEVSQQF